MPFASINPTNPRTNPWNFGGNCSAFWGGWWLVWFPEIFWCAYTFSTQCIHRKHCVLMYTLWTLFLSYSMKDSITSLKKCQKLLPILNFDVILSLAPPPSHSYWNISPSKKISMSFMNPVVNNYTWYSKPLYFRFTVFTCVSTVISLCLFAVQCSGAAVP